MTGKLEGSYHYGANLNSTKCPSVGASRLGLCVCVRKIPALAKLGRGPSGAVVRINGHERK